MVWYMLSLVLASAVACQQQVPRIEPPLKVGAWNLQRFGPKTINNATLSGWIAKVIAEYDLIVLMEVTDSSGKTIPTLLEKYLNNDPDWAYELSPRIGRTSYKEQYAFMYKKSRVSVSNSYKYADTEDTFQIEPFITVFKSNTVRGLSQFAVIPLHAKPDDAAKEIDRLVHVYEDVVTKTGVKDAIILGDLNAGCTYLGQSDIDVNSLANDKRFQWLISDHADTTTKYTTCPYDRIIVAGDAMQASVIKDSAKPFYFDEVFGISANHDLVEEISDHYPVGVELGGAVPPVVASSDEAGSLRELLSVKVVLPSTSEAWKRVLKFVDDDKVCSTGSCDKTFGISTSSKSRGTYSFAIAEWQLGGAANVISFVENLHSLYPEICSAPAASILLHKLQGTSAPQNHVTVTCHRKRKDLPQCTLMVGSPTPLQ